MKQKHPKSLKEALSWPGSRLSKLDMRKIDSASGHLCRATVSFDGMPDYTGEVWSVTLLRYYKKIKGEKLKRDAIWKQAEEQAELLEETGFVKSEGPRAKREPKKTPILEYAIRCANSREPEGPDLWY